MVPSVVTAGVPAINLEEIVVHAQRLELIGEVVSASQGTVLAEQIENRPILRPGEVLEAIPGLVVTQHSGDGKANQYFLRGFNLDHGTDFATRVDGMPVNMPTHAHGQGYTDLNFLIPELVDHVEYGKGTYYAEEGNFSAAGSADVHYRKRLDAPFLELSAGQDHFDRIVAGASPAVVDGTLLMAAEYFHNDGPWDLPEGYQKLGGLLKFSHGDAEHGYGVEAQGYDGHWRSTDQIPLRAVTVGLIDRFGAIDPTDRGRTHRYSVSGDWRAQLAGGQLKANAYAIDYQLDLISNFTYYTDPLHGDQFEQSDSRHVFGTTVTFNRPLSLAGHPGDLSTGTQVRQDDIRPVGLYRTENAVRYATVREDQVRQTSVAVYLSESVRWTPWLRSDVGARVDHFNFKVDSTLAANSGTTSASIASPKLTLAFGPWDRTEYFLNFGRGFHSNDARGTT
ncbi:MAG: TonB-dependent receptor, partial [Proteobacteria bacterium]|nr:TonB-dependent receptor [Pseudomonadota bacterium]